MATQNKPKKTKAKPNNPKVKSKIKDKVPVEFTKSMKKILTNSPKKKTTTKKVTKKK